MAKIVSSLRASTKEVSTTEAAEKPSSLSLLLGVFLIVALIAVSAVLTFSAINL